MALIQVNFVSRSLFRTVTMQVILPVDKLSFDGSPVALPERFKTLYLLHGLLGNYTDWVTGTRVQRWAEERNLAVVMPSGENAFYLDNEQSGNRYGQFIGEELVEVTRRMFPLSCRREDTFIGGLSMGGFGAVRNGLKYHDTFSHIIALSSALQTLEDRGSGMDALRAIAHEDFHFGGLSEAVHSDRNPRVLIEQLCASGAAKPRIYMACGTEDDLLPANRRFRDLFREKGFDLEYYEGPGGHEWDFWDAQLRRAMDWLPLAYAGQGMNSGNVKA